MYLTECLQILREATPTMASSELAAPGSIFPSRKDPKVRDDPMFTSCLTWLRDEPYRFGRLLYHAKIDDGWRFTPLSNEQAERRATRPRRTRRDGSPVVYGSGERVKRFLLDAGRPVLAQEIADALGLRISKVHTYLTRLRIGAKDMIVERAVINGQPFGWFGRHKTTDECVKEFREEQAS